MGSTGPASINALTGKPWGLDFPVITIGDMVDAQVPLIDHLGIDQLFSVIGGSMGGMQVLEWAARHGEPRLHRRADRHGGLALLAEHRLPRGRAAGGDGRSRLAPGPLSGARHRAAQRPRRGAHGRAHHLPLRGGAAAQVRAQPAGPGGQDLQLQRRLPGRELSAPPGLDLRRPLRRQQLSLHHAGDRLLRSRGRARRRAGQRLQGHQDALLRGVVHQRLALSHAREPRDRAGAQRGGGQRQLRRDRVRQGPRRLPARGAGVVRHRARLPQRRRREARAEDRRRRRADAGARRPAQHPRRPPADRGDGGRRLARARRRLRRRRAAAAARPTPRTSTAAASRSPASASTPAWRAGCP